MNPAPLSSLPAKSIKAVFTDLDGTLTTGQSLHPDTFYALSKLQEAGFWVVVVSGRPAGWADCLMRLAPIDAMIFENGAGILTRDKERLIMTSTARTSDSQTLATDRQRLDSLFQSLKKEIPHLKIATDQPFRKYDMAIDFAEEAPFLTESEQERVMEKLRQEKDLTVKLSNIHVNYWVGSHTKITACERLLDSEGKKRAISEDEVVFCGDSPNDEPLFSRFKYTVGVANIHPYLPKMKSLPAFLTKSAEGQGFQELVRFLLSQAR